MRGGQTLTHWRATLTRRCGLDANPLRRGTDRLEAWIRIGLVLVFLIGAPLAGWGAGRWADSAATRTALAQQASDYRVTATLLQSLPRGVDYPHSLTLKLGQVQARWTAPDGSARTGEVQAPLGARAGSTVQVWTDRSGTLTGRPLQRNQIGGWVPMLALIAPVVLALVLLVVVGIAGRLLDRRRLAGWEQAWSAIEPQWTRRLR